MEDEILIRSRTELDVLLINIETSVKIKRRSDFFVWVQGVFQGLLAHDILICSLREPTAGRYRMDWISCRPAEALRTADLYGSSGGLIYRLIGSWERAGRQPILVGAGTGEMATDESLAAEIRSLQLGGVLAHGIPDVEGHAASFFSFFNLPTSLSGNEGTTLELIVPYLHAAWLRVNCEQCTQDGSIQVTPKDILTVREIEILNWVEQGKSNSEIAQILNISHLTVKNHVQKILRKLNVTNRAQAVAKGIALKLTGSRLT